MYLFNIDTELEEKLVKLSKKDKITFEAVLKKIDEIVQIQDITHYKNLRSPMQEFKRVHIRGSFVLLFRYNEQTKKIEFIDLAHHDLVYK